jgi:hypothetical protein
MPVWDRRETLRQAAEAASYAALARLEAMQTREAAAADGVSEEDRLTLETSAAIVDSVAEGFQTDSARYLARSWEPPVASQEADWDGLW